MRQRPGTPRLLRAINDRAALELLLERGPLTRPQLGALTGLSKPTASQLLARLEAQGLVEPVGELEGGRGPNARLYAVVPSAAYVIGVDVGPTHIGPTHIRAAVADITGEIAGRSELTTEGEADPVAVVRAVEAAAAAGGVALPQVNAIVIGTPGLVDPETGDIGFAWDLPSWHRGLLAALRSDLRRQVKLENDVNLAAVAEQHSGSAKDHDDFVLLWVGRGLGLAVVLGGRLYRGATGGAGEIGWLPVSGTPVLTADHHPGPFEGAFQSLVGAESVRILAGQHGFGRSSKGPVAAAAAVREAVEADERGAAFLDELADRLALGVVSVCVVLDPSLVVLGGEVSRAGGSTLARRVETAVARISPFSRPQVRVTAIEAGPVLHGAILTALEWARQQVFTTTTEPTTPAATESPIRVPDVERTSTVDV